ncbi:MAG: hypothetical protein IH884_02395 [Myxococcales bacterium]|nr:hypothetical protein [Myxococcales bacterium]
MAHINENFRKLQAGYLFPEIGRRVREFSEANPDASIIRLGIGDVTLPLAPAVVEAMHRAVDEMGTGAGFHGYGPENGYDFLLEPIVEHDFRARGIELIAPAVTQQLPEDELTKLVEDVDGIVAGDDPFTEAVITSAKRLKVLIKWGVGADSIDVASLERRGIEFSNTPGVFGDEVADVAIGYIIMLARHLHVIDREVRKGHWSKPRGMTLRHKTVGVVGLGSVGRQVVVRAMSLGMLSIGYDIRDDIVEVPETASLHRVTLEELLCEADFVVLCCELTSQNRHMIDVHGLALAHEAQRNRLDAPGRAAARQFAP